MNQSSPPDFDFTRVAPRAVIDFITITADHSVPVIFSAGREAVWRALEEPLVGGTLTLQDPNAADLIWLQQQFPKSLVMELEIAVDFWPVTGCTQTERQELIDNTMLAIAGRLRPDEACPLRLRVARVSWRWQGFTPTLPRPPAADVGAIALGHARRLDSGQGVPEDPGPQRTPADGTPSRSLGDRVSPRRTDGPRDSSHHARSLSPLAKADCALPPVHRAT